MSSFDAIVGCDALELPTIRAALAAGVGGYATRLAAINLDLTAVESDLAVAQADITAEEVVNAAQQIEIDGFVLGAPALENAILYFDDTDLTPITAQSILPYRLVSAISGTAITFDGTDELTIHEKGMYRIGAGLRDGGGGDGGALTDVLEILKNGTTIIGICSGSWQWSGHVDAILEVNDTIQIRALAAGTADLTPHAHASLAEQQRWNWFRCTKTAAIA
jgi:hypothetical protein